jgi:hypothetical protein
MTTPLIEDYSEESGASGSSGATGAGGATAAASGPSITFSTASGDEFQLDAETLQMYLLLTQTLLLLYVTYKEASG